MIDQLLHELQAGHVARAIGRRIVIAAAGLADPGDDVKRRVARAGRIRISARIEQQRGQFIVRVADGEVQRAVPGLRYAMWLRDLAPRHRDGVVDVGSALQERLHDVHAAFADGEQKGVEAGVEAFMVIRAGLNQRLHHFDVAFRRGPHQGRLLAAAFLDMQIGAVREQGLHRVHFARAGRGHQRGFPTGKGGVGVSAGFEQQFDHRRRRRWCRRAKAA